MNWRSKRLLSAAALAAITGGGAGSAVLLHAATVQTVVTETFTNIVTYTIPTHTETATVTETVTVTETTQPPTTTTTEPPPTTTEPPAPQVELRAVDGGPGYYAGFTQPLSSDPGYFPIGAWFRPAEPHQMAAYTNFGLNLFVGVENPEGVNEQALRQAGMRTLVQIGERTRFNDLGAEVAGWLLDDEADMQHGPGTDTVNCTGPHHSGSGAISGYQVMRQANASTPADGKARYANYGKGVYMWETDPQAACFINAFQHLQSIDMYWMTDPNERSRMEYGFPSSYGLTVARARHLDGLDGERKPQWNFVETAWPWTETAAQGGRRILPAEARAAVWHSIIAGARGIIYFDHSFGGPCRQTVIRRECYPDTHDALQATNQQVRQLAPALNGPHVTSGFTATGNVRYAVKWSGSSFYVLAGTNRAAGVFTFSMPCVGDATVTVEGEGRTLPMNGGSFTDTFADKNSIHLYRVVGGGRCGL